MQKILAIVSDILEHPVTEDSSRETLPDWDSLKTLQIIMALDEAGISIPLEKIADIQSVRVLVIFSGQSHA